jgi:ABC-type nickel/cobalt efflux system permease component RcnA
MRRVVILAAALLALAAAPAGAHPLGNFSVNHLTEVRVSSDRIDLRYLLDQAELPTFQERSRTGAQVLAAKRAEVRRGLRVTVDGRAIPLRFAGERLSHPPGQGGLPLTRIEFRLVAPASGARVAVRDDTFPERLGWRAIVARPGAGTAVRSSTPVADPTGGLRRYPPGERADQRAATLSVAAGRGTVSGPAGDAPSTERPSGGFEGLLSDAAAGQGALLLVLLAAFGWGAAHALSPGHGKAMVAAYLVGTRGRPRDALALGAVVTVTHTAGVFALGFVALGLSQWVLPEDLYPWLTLVSGLLVLLVGAGVLRQRLRPPRHHHHHHHPATRKGLLAMGASAGVIPCPSALIVLLGALSQHQLGLGIGLIVAFSAGLAATLSALGLAVVGAGRALERLPVPGLLSRALPAASAAAIVIVGLVLTVGAASEVG